MNTVKKCTMALLATLSVSAAQAFTPPFSMIYTPATGTATIQMTGSCKFKQTFENAQWGEAEDSMGDPVGYAIISAEGQLLAVLEDYAYISGSYDTDTFKGHDVYMENFSSDLTEEVLETLAGCDVEYLVTSAKTKGTYNYDPDKNLNNFVVQYIFNGIGPTVTEKKGTKETYKPQPFTGKITFKGDYPAL